MTRVIILFLLILLLPAKSNAIDLFGLGKLGSGVVEGTQNIKDTANIISSSLERSISQIHELQNKTDIDLRYYLSEIDRIISDSVHATEISSARLIMEAKYAALELENKIYTDFRQLIFDLECAGTRTLLDTLQQSIANSINLLRQSNPKLKILGITVAEGTVEPVHVTEPDVAYFSIKKERLNQLFSRNSVNPEDNSYNVISVYANIARLARQARCHYTDTPEVAAIFTRDIREMNRLIAPWVRY